MQSFYYEQFGFWFYRKKKYGTVWLCKYRYYKAEYLKKRFTHLTVHSIRIAI